MARPLAIAKPAPIRVQTKILISPIEASWTSSPSEKKLIGTGVCYHGRAEPAVSNETPLSSGSVGRGWSSVIVPFPLKFGYRSDLGLVLMSRHSEPWER